MTSLATDIDFEPGSLVCTCIRIIALGQAGRMAFGAHDIPGLPSPGPVQPVVSIFHLIWRQAVPDFFLNIPGDIQALQATVRERYQILLQRIKSEGVSDLEITRLTIRPLGLDEELAVLAVKAGGDIVVRIGVTDIAKITQYGCFVSHIHGQVVM